MKKFFITLMCIVIVVCFMPTVAMADEGGQAKGTIDSVTLLKDGLSIELKDLTPIQSNTIVEVQVYSGDVLLTTAKLNSDKLSELEKMTNLTCCIPTKAADEYWPQDPDWTPRADQVPTKAVLNVNGSETSNFTINSINKEAWAKRQDVAPAPAGKIIRAYLTTDRITVDMADVTFYDSVALELCSGETVLTTSTLNTESLQAGTYGELTGMISLTAADKYWSYEQWTPKKNVVPNNVKLIVDGAKKDNKTIVVVFNGEETRDITDDDWKALKATVYTASGSIERAAITHDNGNLKNAVSVDLKDVAFNKSVEVKLYSGETLLTTATLKDVEPGSYRFLTCCIATEAADEYWDLTPWTPMDKVVPNKAVLYVDGQEQGEKTFTLDETEWANLPGTKAPQNFTGGYGYTDPLRAAKDKAIKEVTNYVGAAGYEEAQQAEIKTIVDNAKKDIEAAKTADEIKAIEAAAKAELDKLETAEEMALIRTIQQTQFKARSKATTLNGRKAIRVTWNKPADLEFDGYEVYRSTERYKGYGTEPFFTTTNQKYTNNKGLKVGKTYYYKVRGFKYVNDEKVYTEYSLKAWRTVK